MPKKGFRMDDEDLKAPSTHEDYQELIKLLRTPVKTPTPVRKVDKGAGLPTDEADDLPDEE